MIMRREGSIKVVNLSLGVFICIILVTLCQSIPSTNAVNVGSHQHVDDDVDDVPHRHRKKKQILGDAAPEMMADGISTFDASNIASIAPQMMSAVPEVSVIDDSSCCSMDSSMGADAVVSAASLSTESASSTSSISRAKSVAPNQPVAVKRGSQPTKGVTTVKRTSDESYYRSITKAAARSGLISVTRHSLQYSPLLIEGKTDEYVKKVGTKATFDAARGAAFKALATKWPIAKDVIIYGSLSYKVGSVCMEGTWTECGISAVTQVSKFASYKWLGTTGVLMLTPNIWAGAVCYGVGQFLIDNVFDKVEVWFEPSASKQKFTN